MLEMIQCILFSVRMSEISKRSGDIEVANLLEKTLELNICKNYTKNTRFMMSQSFSENCLNIETSRVFNHFDVKFLLNQSLNTCDFSSECRPRLNTNDKCKIEFNRTYELNANSEEEVFKECAKHYGIKILTDCTEIIGLLMLVFLLVGNITILLLSLIVVLLHFSGENEYEYNCTKIELIICVTFLIIQSLCLIPASNTACKNLELAILSVALISLSAFALSVRLQLIAKSSIAIVSSLN